MIILQTKQLNSGAFEWNIHFWLGKDTSQDEKGTAAIKSVELDDLLGGSPVQHRETQEYESNQFHSLFKGGIRYVPGGVKSGFKHYDPESAPPRLFCVKGKRNVRVREVEVSVKSMNKGDCFILDTPKLIYVYIGRFSRRVERLKAVQAANQIRDQDHGGRVKIQMIEPNSPQEEVDAYFKALGGGSRDEMADPPKEDDDVAFEKQTEGVVTLYRVSDESGSLKVDKVGVKPLKGEMLKSQDCFILDTGKSGIFVWIGKKCTREEKLQSMKHAESFLQKNGYPEWTKLQRVVDGGEPTAFKQYFSVWRESDTAPLTFGKVYTLDQLKETNSFVASSVSTTSKMSKKDMGKLLKNLGKALGFCPDDGKGHTDLFRVENFELAPVAPETHGCFFGGDSYVLRYRYTEKNREKYIIYFWQGTDSTQDEKAAAALHAIRLDDELHGKAIQVRVVQGNEPAHFLRIFKGRMIIFRGGHASGFKNVRQHDTYDPTKPKLFHVKGTCEDDTRAVEVEPIAASLDSDDVFVLDGPGVTYMWIGNGASEDEKAMGRNVDKLVSPDRVATVVAEGSEPEEFWKLLGGKGPYNKEEYERDTPSLEATLFHCSINPPSTKLNVEEINNFTQDDLNEDDVMVLDTGADEIFIWIGKGASPEEKKASNTMTDDYIRQTHQRASGNAVTISIVVKQGEEPESFKVLFPTWNEKHWDEMKSLEDLMKGL
ncbi:Gelsolin, cytoplasmic [Orchesella cincta]|uniref:Gelsolin, cytoplasmic n=1 Tax=Orchesella cincta TaxID=48709 RepID=A0A1D2MPP5_ORCCI|nr:Gelsolin, cytoplasmic [Orchesella cincta]